MRYVQGTERVEAGDWILRSEADRRCLRQALGEVLAVDVQGHDWQGQGQAHGALVRLRKPARAPVLIQEQGLRW